MIFCAIQIFLLTYLLTYGVKIFLFAATYAQLLDDLDILNRQRAASNTLVAKVVGATTSEGFIQFIID